VITVRTTLLALMAAAGLIYAFHWMRVSRAGASGFPSPVQIAIGFVTNFFDTLGIGSFATTTTAFKALGMVRDEYIPGTMIVGHTLPVVCQALIFVTIVKVESTVLLTLIVATLVGGWFGAGVVSRLPRRPVQLGMGVALLAAAVFMVMGQLGLFPSGGDALGLPPGKLLFAALVNMIIGALLMLGIGNYGPCLVLLSLLGMDPRAAFPIMMGAGAFVAPAGAVRFMKAGRYDQRAALGLAIGGIPAVLIAGLIVRSLPLDVVRWLVVVIVTCTALVMLKSAAVREDAPGEH
jgi:uncharacterized membrane protein YfcA